MWLDKREWDDHLSNEVCADVCCFCVDSATQLSKQRHKGSAKAVTNQKQRDIVRMQSSLLTHQEKIEERIQNSHAQNSLHPHFFQVSSKERTTSAPFRQREDRKTLRIASQFEEVLVPIVAQHSLLEHWLEQIPTFQCILPFLNRQHQR